MARQKLYQAAVLTWALRQCLGVNPILSCKVKGEKTKKEKSQHTRIGPTNLITMTNQRRQLNKCFTQKEMQAKPSTE